MLAVPLGDGRYGFGQVCVGLEQAYFDLVARQIPTLEAIVSSPVAFRVLVASDAVAAGGWKVLGNTAVRPELSNPGVYRHRPVGSASVYRYSAGVSAEASEEEVAGLEVFAVWFSMHIEERLRCHFAGQIDRFSLSLADCPPAGPRRT